MTQATGWDAGQQPGRRVVVLASLAALSASALNLVLTGRLSLFFDLTFVVICLAAAMAVRPRDFFVVGVMPPLLMLGVVVVLSLTAREAVAERVDGVVQAVVSGLAHHAGALAGGYLSALVVLALRQVATRDSGGRSRLYA